MCAGPVPLLHEHLPLPLVLALFRLFPHPRSPRAPRWCIVAIHYRYPQSAPSGSDGVAANITNPPSLFCDAVCANTDLSNTHT